MTLALRLARRAALILMVDRVGFIAMLVAWAGLAYSTWSSSHRIERAFDAGYEAGFTDQEPVRVYCAGNRGPTMVGRRNPEVPRAL